MWNSLSLGYTESQGHPVLLNEIANLYQRIEVKNVLEVVPEEGIFIMSHALLQPGDHIVCTMPGYQSLYEIARSIGCQISAWHPIEERGWEFALDDLEALLREDTKLVIANFPHNPTGYLPTTEEFLELIDLVRARGIYFFCDEMYRLLELEEGTTLPAACDLYEKAISLTGLSKVYGLPGLRMGWLASKNQDFIDRVIRLKDYTTICGSAPSEILAIMAIRNRSRIIEKQNARVRINLTIFKQFLDKHPDIFDCQLPKGSSVCFPKLLLDQDSYEFSEQVVKEAGIMLAPSRMFHYGDQHIRIGLGRENFPQVLQHFTEYLKSR
jgi:aspartate/methionine/tyrosine aminotransferase